MDRNPTRTQSYLSSYLSISFAYLMNSSSDFKHIQLLGERAEYQLHTPIIPHGINDQKPKTLMTPFDLRSHGLRTTSVGEEFVSERNLARLEQHQIGDHGVHSRKIHAGDREPVMVEQGLQKRKSIMYKRGCDARGSFAEDTGDASNASLWRAQCLDGHVGSLQDEHAAHVG